MSRIVSLCCALVLLFSAGQALAQGGQVDRPAERLKAQAEKEELEVAMAGQWNRPNGEGAWVLLYIRDNGGPLLYLAKNEAPAVRWVKWVAGMEGTQFSYMAPNKKDVVLTQNPKNPEAMSAAWSDGSRESLSRVARVNVDSPLYGAWKGDWGGSFHLVEVGNTIYHIHVGSKADFSVATGSWVPGMEGTQYAYKYPNLQERTATLNAKGTPRITGVTNGKRWAAVQSYKPVSLRGVRIKHRRNRRILDGVWRNPGMGDLHLSANKRDFHVAKLYQNDATFDLKAGWTRDMRGIQFELLFRGETITCTYNKKRPAFLRCTDSRGDVSEWRK